ncbi:CbtA family protein [Mycobacterium sp. RTGN5]|uniref:CbtA family protein n=1 Tax=Mycobacterium sp. RTGN5 TaxID=3016522 RepID=UPI0029C7664A|nr:CbtA family protein [Mycobacterium sp. RTGN5]
MPLTAELPSTVRYLIPGVVGGIVSFAFSRVMIEPLIGAAVDYEGEREHAEAQLSGGDHEHGHELFTRSVQENFGAAVGVIAFTVAMGVLFAVAYTVIRTVLERRGATSNPTGLALLLSAGMFAAITLVPGLKYPANPPTVGLEETIGARSSAFLTITVISVVGACVAVAAGLAWSRRWGSWPATALAVGGYVAVMLVAFVLLPSFHEVPGPIAGPDGLLLDGFPAEVLGEFRMYSMLNQALMWVTIGATWACLSALSPSMRRGSALVSAR